MNQSDSTNSTTEFVTKSLQWIHPPASLIQGKVTYVVRMLGYTEVGASSGATVIRDAYLSIKAANEKSGNPQKLAKVELSINVSDVQISDYKTKILMHSHSLRKISYCADDKMDRRIFAYIATDDSKKLICYVFFTSDDSIAKQITSTIGEAFDLALHEYFNKTLPKNDDISKLREKIQQLETENDALKAEISFYKRKCGIVEMEDIVVPVLQLPPPLPKTPIPKPPSGFALPGSKNPFLLPSSIATAAADLLPPRDQAPSLDYPKSPTTKFASTAADISFLLSGSDEISNSNKGKVSGDKKKTSDQKLLMLQVSQQDSSTASAGIKVDSKNSESSKTSSPQAQTSANINAPTKEEAEDDDEYMTPTYKLANP